MVPDFIKPGKVSRKDAMIVAPVQAVFSSKIMLDSKRKGETEVQDFRFYTM